MTDQPSPFERHNDPSTGLLRVLNSHGYGFQYRALKECLVDGWRLAVAEYPVELNGVSTHIDFVLGYKRHLVVVECKRVDGWTWGFARGLSMKSQPRADFLYWQHEKLLRQSFEIGPWQNATYDTAVEMKQEAKQHAKDATSKTPKTLDTAVAQVLRGRGGLMEDFGARQQFRYGGGAVIPMILTTAGLVATDTHLDEANFHTGNLVSLQATSTDFVWYDHNLSGPLRPRVPRELSPKESQYTKTEAMKSSLAHDMARSVAIVTPNGIRLFLQNLSNLLEYGSDPI